MSAGDKGKYSNILLKLQTFYLWSGFVAVCHISIFNAH